MIQCDDLPIGQSSMATQELVSSLIIVPPGQPQPVVQTVEQLISR